VTGPDGRHHHRLSDEPPEKPVTGQFDSSYYEDLRGRVRGVLIAVSEMFPAQRVQLLVARLWPIRLGRDGSPR
jgi:hypothetical protein